MSERSSSAGSPSAWVYRADAAHSWTPPGIAASPEFNTHAKDGDTCERVLTWKSDQISALKRRYMIATNKRGRNGCTQKLKLHTQSITRKGENTMKGEKGGQKNRPSFPIRS